MVEQDEEELQPVKKKKDPKKIAIVIGKCETEEGRLYFDNPSIGFEAAYNKVFVVLDGIGYDYFSMDAEEVRNLSSFINKNVKE